MWMDLRLLKELGKMTKQKIQRVKWKAKVAANFLGVLMRAQLQKEEIKMLERESQELPHSIREAKAIKRITHSNKQKPNNRRVQHFSIATKREIKNTKKE